MAINDELGIRMKEFYEKIPSTKLIRRVPVAIRIDGKAFHTLTKGFEKPFDDILIRTMQRTMQRLCENIQGCVLGYTQSDEITLILQDYKKLTSYAWFDYKVQKICSVAASMTTLYFNQIFREEVNTYSSGKVMNEYIKTLELAKLKGAMFDARCFNIPKEEVCNLLYWRQLDAVRNSIQMVAQANFSHQQIQNKNSNQIQEMLFSEKGINWNDLPSYKKRGSCCTKKYSSTQDFNECTGNLIEGINRSQWEIDLDIPTFNSAPWKNGIGRDYVENVMNSIVEEG